MTRYLKKKTANIIKAMALVLDNFSMNIQNVESRSGTTTETANHRDEAPPD
jgi:hypothetical protein